MVVLALPPWVRLPRPSTARHILWGVLFGFSLSITSTSIALYFQRRKQKRIEERFERRPIELRSDEVVSGVTGLIGVLLHTACIIVILICLIGNTPLVRINSLSDALGVEILGKAEVRVHWRFDDMCRDATERNIVLESRRKRQGSCCPEKYASEQFLKVERV